MVHGEPSFPLSSKPQIKEETAEEKGGNVLVKGETVVVTTVVKVVSASSTGMSVG